MSYVECVRCGLTAYSAARWSTIDHCARCGAPLPHARSVTPIARLTPERPADGPKLASDVLGAISNPTGGRLRPAR
jgi:ribosomal protein L37E